MGLEWPQNLFRVSRIERLPSSVTEVAQFPLGIAYFGVQ